MSTVSSASAVMASVGTPRSAIQIAVPTTEPSQGAPTDFMLEAAVRRVSTLLYMRSHLEAPPDVIDMGGGLFNVKV
jgi:hypothetical protein